MSKRDAGARVATYVEQGYTPEAVRNYLCLLGWSPKDNREKIDIDEVVKLFELEKINRRNAAFDLDKCFWLNGQYIAQMSLDRFIELARPFLEKAKIDISDQAYLRAVLAIVKEKIKLLSDVPEWTHYFFTENYEFDPPAVETPGPFGPGIAAVIHFFCVAESSRFLNSPMYQGPEMYIAMLPRWNSWKRLDTCELETGDASPCR